MEVNAPGKTMLLVVSILYIVFSGFGIIGSLALIGIGGALDTVGAGGDVTSLGFLALLASAFGLVIGILGIAFRKKVEKAVLLMGLGAAAIVFDIVAGAATGTLGPLSIIGFVLPVLYIIGAYMNKKAA